MYMYVKGHVLRSFEGSLYNMHQSFILVFSDCWVCVPSPLVHACLVYILWSWIKLLPLSTKVL
jgi:hypothetical protein